MTQSAQLGDVPNATFGITVRQGLNTSDLALATQNAGTSAPPVTFSRMIWFDETLNRIKQRNGTNTAWFVMTVFASTAPGAGDDENDGIIVGTQWFDDTGNAVYFCTDPTADAAVWVDLTDIGGGGGGGAVITGDEDFIISRTAGGGASTAVAWDASSGSLLLRGAPVKVSSAGAVSGTWQPALGSSVGDIIRATAADDITLGLPTGDVPPSGYRAEYQIFIQNTSTTDAIFVTYGEYVIEGASGPQRRIPAGQTQAFWIATEDGGSTWRIVGTPRLEFSIEISSPFTPEASTEFIRHNVYHPLQIPLAHDDISLPRCITAPSGTVDFIVYHETGPSGSPTKTPVLKATFSSGYKYATWTAWNGSTWVSPTMALAVEWLRDDRVVVASPANLYGLEGLTWVMVGGQREYQPS